MRCRNLHSLATSALIAVAASCSRASAPVERPPVLHALVRGAVAAEITVPAFFVVSFEDGASRGDYVVFASQSDSAPSGITIVVTHLNGTPTLGASEIQSPAQSFARHRGFHMIFLVEPVEFQEQYASESGSITITESSSDYIAGSFQIQAKRYCRRVGLRVDGSCDPRVVSPNAPGVTIEGVFRARRGANTR